MRSGGDSGPRWNLSWYLGIAWGPVFRVGGLRRDRSWLTRFGDDTAEGAQIRNELKTDGYELY